MAFYRARKASGGVTPTSITPSDSSPVQMTTGNAYSVTRTGYAIGSQLSNKTPDDNNPPSVLQDEVVRMGGAGYLYATQQSSGSISGYSLSAKDVTTAATSKSITNQNGKILLLFVFMFAQSSDLPYNRYDSITVSGGTATKITTLMDSNARVAGTFFKLSVTSNTCTVTSSNNMRIIAFEGDVS